MDNSNNNIALIIGAGPSGLACAYELIEKSSIKPVIIEKLPCVGGLSRTVYKDGLGVDIGGHRLYTNDEYVKSIWFKFLNIQGEKSIDDILSKRDNIYPKNGLNPSEIDDVMLIRKRFSSIIYNSKFFPYPLKISFDTFLKLGIITSFKAGLSYFKSLIFKRKEISLEDFMINRFGEVLYSIFFKDYTKKVWGIDALKMPCEWGHQRIRKLSLLKTVLNSILSGFKFLKFKKETSLIDEFYYPKFGCSQLWGLMADYIVKKGGKIILNSEFVDFNCHENKILSVRYKNESGNIEEIPAQYAISSIPIKDLIKGVDAPYDIKQDALNLPYRDYILVSFYLDDFKIKNNTNYKTVNNITPDCWIYIQEKEAIVARMQIMNNWSPYLVKQFDKKYLVSLEYFANEGDDFWSKTDKEIIELASFEAEKFNLFDKKDIIDSFVVRQKYAYPVYCGTYKNIDKIKNHLMRYSNLYLIGRNGQHKYNNMDEAMVCGINIARDIIENG